MSKTPALDKLFNIFHKTRLTSNVSVPQEIVNDILTEAGYYDVVTNGQKSFNTNLKPEHN